MRPLCVSLFLCTALAGCANHEVGETPKNLAAKGLVYIGGHEVIKPGTYPWHDGMTLKEAIKVAGGSTQWANNIAIIHVDGTNVHFRYARILSGNIKDPVLLPGDRISVFQSGPW